MSHYQIKSVSSGIKLTCRGNKEHKKALAEMIERCDGLKSFMFHYVIEPKCDGVVGKFF